MPKKSNWPKDVAKHIDAIGKARQTAFERLKKVEAAREKGEAELERAVAEAIPKLEASHKNLAPPTANRRLPLPGQLPWLPEPIPPFGVPIPTTRFEMICNLNVDMLVQNYAHFGGVTHGVGRANSLSGKRSSLGVQTTNADSFCRAFGGFASSFTVPRADGPTSIEITSWMDPTLVWYEAFALNGGFASVSAFHHFLVTLDNQTTVHPAVRFFHTEAKKGEHSVIEVPLSERILPDPVGTKMELTAAPGNERSVTVQEFCELIAATTEPINHAALSGWCTWLPLRVHMSEGCRPVAVGGWGFWGSGKQR